MILKTKDGRKLYPVCSWEENQHKLYNAHDRIMNAIDDNGWSEELEKNLRRCEQALEAFDACVRCGIVYATWEDGQLIKDFVWAYDARH